MIATGIAISSGQGVATTTTLRNRIGIAARTTRRPPAIARASGVYHAPS